MTPGATTFAAVRRLARTIPGVEDGTSWGTPSLKVNGRMLACMAIHRSAEPRSLIVVMPVAERDELIVNAPDVFYLTPHYEPHATVLVRLERIHPDALRDLLAAGARRLAAKPKARARKT
ncbi:MAG TPA: MmcQ/YjbR family DNA-binding protein [Vicinamibacterales bacterium]|nr:MmcQ/YjbR family DNA-binding protein [Vicinamibacterales bacterium]